MRQMKLYPDEREFLNRNYQIGVRYKVSKLNYSEECEYLKEGMTGTLIEFDNAGFFHNQMGQ